MIMGAHNAATLAYAAKRVQFVAERLNTQSSWSDTFAAIVAAEPRQIALKRWIAEGAELNTLQVHVHLENAEPVKLSSAWSPGSRIVETVRASSFTFDTGSSREYAGLTCYAATDDYWIGFNKWNDSTVELVCYRREG